MASLRVRIYQNVLHQLVREHFARTLFTCTVRADDLRTAGNVRQQTRCTLAMCYTSCACRRALRSVILSSLGWPEPSALMHADRYDADDVLLRPAPLPSSACQRQHQMFNDRISRFMHPVVHGFRAAGHPPVTCPLNNSPCLVHGGQCEMGAWIIDCGWIFDETGDTLLYAICQVRDEATVRMSGRICQPFGSKPGRSRPSPVHWELWQMR